MTKFEQMKAWLAVNPGKTERDWLLEVRCLNEADRQAMDRLLTTLDNGGVKYGICVAQTIFYPNNQHKPLDTIKEVQWDVMIAPGVGKNSYAIEADMPDEVLGVQTKNGECDIAPIAAYKWLLKNWVPDFDIEALDKLEAHKLLWSGMRFVDSINGTRGFVNWKDPDFGSKVVEKYIREKAEIEEIVAAQKKN